MAHALLGKRNMLGIIHGSVRAAGYLSATINSLHTSFVGIVSSGWAVGNVLHQRCSLIVEKPKLAGNVRDSGIGMKLLKSLHTVRHGANQKLRSVWLYASISKSLIRWSRAEHAASLPPLEFVLVVRPSLGFSIVVLVIRATFAVPIRASAILIVRCDFVFWVVVAVIVLGYRFQRDQSETLHGHRGSRGSLLTIFIILVARKLSFAVVIFAVGLP